MSKKNQRWDLIAFALLLAGMMAYAFFRSSHFYDKMPDAPGPEVKNPKSSY